MRQWEGSTSPGQWKELPFKGRDGNYGIKFSGSSAEITGLTNGVKYAHAVASKKGSTYSDWSAFQTTEPKEYRSIGYQKDFTVKYAVGVMPTPGTPFPAGTPEPAAVIPTSIPIASARWNAAIRTATPTLDLYICKIANAGCDDSNSDNYTVTVLTVTKNTSSTNKRISHDFSTGCGVSVACVKFKNGLKGPAGELPDLALVIEEPAWESNTKKILWTHRAKDDLEPGNASDEVWFYIGATMLHEFGHTLGLPDFPDYVPHEGVMKDNHKHKSIKAVDIEYLQKIYKERSNP